MLLNEIDTKYFRFHKGVVDLLESYKDPSNELDISFDHVDEDMGKYYYKGTVIERSTKDILLRIDISIFESDTNAVIIDNIIPNQSKIDSVKTVYTSIGQQNTGIDMGHKAMKWIFNKVKEFATSLGFHIKQIKSSSRYTGARAKNNPGGSIPKSFDVNVNITESIIYSYFCDTGELIVYKE